MSSLFEKTPHKPAGGAAQRGHGPRALLACVTLLAAVSAWGESCRVLDPELSGVYEGGCKNGLAHGFGQAEGSNATYHGYFRAGMKHGKGIKVWSHGDRYEGEFRNDRRNGQGVYTWGAATPWAGEKYTGEFKNDLRQGHGVYQWPSGDRFEGRWEQGNRLGLTPMENRQQAAAKALAEAFRPGTAVCAETPLGIGGARRIKAAVEAVQDRKIRVKVLDPGAGGEPYQGQPVAGGTVLTDDLYNWALCR